MRVQMKLVSRLICLSFVGLGLAQEAPAPTAAHDGNLRLAPATENRLPQRPARKADAKKVEVIRPKPVNGEDGLVLSGGDPNEQIVLKEAEASVLGFRPDAAGWLFGGYDPVARFEARELVKGRGEFVADFGGGKVRFISEKNRLKFVAEPEAYLSEFGDYCAYHMAKGEVVRADATSYRIVGGRMYVFRSEAFALTWEKDSALHLGRAREVWGRLAKR